MFNLLIILFLFDFCFIIVAWGKKRNRRAQTLQTLDLSDNLNFTTQILYWLSTTAINITYLDLRNCPNIELMKGVGELHTMKKLTHIFLGPSDIPVNSKKFALSLESHMVSTVCTGGLDCICFWFRCVSVFCFVRAIKYFLSTNFIAVRAIDTVLPHLI